MVTRAARDDVHAVDEVELLRRQVKLVNGERAVHEPPSKRVADDARLLVNLLQHKIGVSALFCQVKVPIDMRDARLDRTPRLVGVFDARRGHARVLAVSQDDDVARGVDHGNHVGSDVCAVFPLPDNNRGILSRDRDDARLHVANSGKAVGAHDARARIAQRRNEIALIGLFKKMGDDLGIGLAREHVPATFKLFAQLSEVLDDAVVHDGDMPAARSVRVRVRFARFAMRSPTRVPDAARALEIKMRQRVLQTRHLAFAMNDSKGVALLHRDASRIVTAVLKPCQTLNENALSWAFTSISHDSAHMRAPCRQARAALFPHLF